MTPRTYCIRHVLSILLFLVLFAPAAAGAIIVAQEPTPGAIPGTVCRLTLFNDSLYAGIGIMAALFGYDEMNGNDAGFTYGMELAVERLARAGTTGTWALGSRLFTRRQPTAAAGDQQEEVPIWLTEEESFSYIADTRRRRESYFVEYGGGILYDAKTFVSVGASGQQKWFHENFNSDGQTAYRYDDDGRAAWGIFVHAGYGIQGERPLTEAGTSVSGNARIALEPNTLIDASQLILSVAATVGNTTGTQSVSASISVEAILHPEGVGYTPAVELAYERRGWGIRSSVSFPLGELRNHVRYNDDTDPISNLSLFIRFAQ